MTQPITDIAIADMPAALHALGMKPYATGQMLSWLYKKRVASFDAMTNLSREGRAKLREHYVAEALQLASFLSAEDGTIKFLCRAADGAMVECVLIPAEDGRTTVCLSTQAGCAMKCAFCRTGGMGFSRNLTQGEILGQLLIAWRHATHDVTNVVFMGMGEPLANIEAVRGAIDLLLDERAFGLSKRRVTLSTCGLIPELVDFSSASEVKIAISLNATTDEVRDELMPINRRYPIAAIMDFCRLYSESSKHRVTFEYVLIRDVNDTREDARRLVGLLRGIRAKINLIPFNPFEGCSYQGPDQKNVIWWHEFLLMKGIQSNIRASRGREIMAACGQLAAAAHQTVSMGE